MGLDLLDWRRQVFSLYAEVRSTAESAVAHEAWRAGREELIRSHPQSPLSPQARREFRGLRHAPYDPALRWDLEVDGDVAPVRLEVPTATDGVVPFERIGVVRLPDLGSLDVWWLASYGGGVFVPVRDANPDTYGGGRYLLDTVKGADLGGDVRSGVLTIDLNFSYNPSCAYDPRWVCPLAQAGNTLAVAVNAGELTA